MKGPILLWRSGLPVALLAAGFLLMSCGDDREEEDPGLSTGPPEITWVFPDTGDVWGGLEVAITTANFRDDFLTNTPLVFFGSDAAVLTPIDPVTVRAVTPPHLTEEAVDVEVRSTGIVESAVLVGGFTYRVSVLAAMISNQGGPGASREEDEFRRGAVAGFSAYATIRSEFDDRRHLDRTGIRHPERSRPTRGSRGLSGVPSRTDITRPGPDLTTTRLAFARLLRHSCGPAELPVAQAFVDGIEEES